jgi:DNA-binding NarL/FixJ family response regulator
VVASSADARAELEAALKSAGHPTITVVGRTPDVIVVDGDASLAPNRQAPMIVLLDNPSTQATTALRSGARGVLRREASPAELIAAIEAVAAGLVVLHPDAVPKPPPSGAGEPLTRREREILTLLADGLGNKVIAARLGISDHTVKAHVGAIFDKLHVGTRAEAVALGLRLGLIAL